MCLSTSHKLWNCHNFEYVSRLSSITIYEHTSSVLSEALRGLLIFTIGVTYIEIKWGSKGYARELEKCL